MDREKIHNYLYYIVMVGGILFLGALLWYLLADVSNQRDGLDSARDSLTRAQVEQRSAGESIERIGSGLDDSIVRTEESAQRIENAESRIDSAQKRIDGGADIIRSSQQRITAALSIIEKVRAGARKD